MTLYCGIDLNSTDSVIEVSDEDGKTVFEKRLPNNLKTIIGVLEPYRGMFSRCRAVSTYGGESNTRSPRFQA